MSAETIIKQSMFGRAKSAITLATALEAHGIDPAAADVGAAIADKLAGATDPALVAKAAKFDALAAQAKDLEIDLEATADKPGALADHIEASARKILGASLGDNAPKVDPPKGDDKPDPTPDPSTMNGEQLAAEFERLAAKDPQAAGAFFAIHSDKFASHLNLNKEG